MEAELWAVRQWPRESLKSYVERFQEVLDANPGYDDKKACDTLRWGLQATPLVGKFAHKQPQSLDEIMSILQYHIAKETIVDI